MRLDDHSNLNDGSTQLEDVLATGNEHDVQKVIHEHPQLLRGITPGVEFAFREYRLGAEFIADFVTGGFVDNGMYLRLSMIELESPKHKLFTKHGDPTAALNHALRQIRDWRAWIKENRLYFTSRTIKKLDYPARAADGVKEAYVVVIGRRSSMSRDDQRRLADLNDDGTHVMTYDGLLDQYNREAKYWSGFHKTINLIDSADA